MHVEELLSRLGGPGRYQVIVYICLWLCSATVSISNVLIVVIGYTPPHRCNPPSNYTRESNVTMEMKETQCMVNTKYNVSTENKVSCPDGWYFQLNGKESTIVSEWSLVCNERYLVNLASTLYFVGVLIGSALFGQLADMFGRKFILLITLYSYIVVSIGVYFTESIITFLIVRIVVGCFAQGIQVSSYVLLTEMTVLKYRPIIAGISDCFWPFGVLWLATLSWIIPQWRILQLVICLPLLITVVYIKIVPESIRWLISKRMFTKAEKISRIIAQFNNIEIPDDLELYIDHANVTESKTTKYTFWHIYKTRNIRKRTIIFGYAWFASTFGYYGLLLMSSQFPGNRHRNFFIGGIVEVAAEAITVCVMRFLPRRWPLSLCYMCGGIACIASGALNTSNNEDIAKLSTVLAIIGRFFMTASFPIVSLFSVESFPTVLRAIAFGSCIFWSRISATISPQIILLGDYTFREVPFIIFGVSSIVASIATLFLPETRENELPDTIEDIEKERSINMGQLITKRTSEYEM